MWRSRRRKFWPLSNFIARPKTSGTGTANNCFVLGGTTGRRGIRRDGLYFFAGDSLSARRLFQDRRAAETRFLCAMNENPTDEIDSLAGTARQKASEIAESAQ